MFHFWYSYTFDSKDCNYATCFRLVLDEEATNEIPESFAYVSNGQLMINGTGTLQVMDILGRQILTKEISTLNSQLHRRRICGPPLQWQRRENPEDSGEIRVF